MRICHVFRFASFVIAAVTLIAAPLGAGIIGDPGPDNGWSSIGAAAVGNPSAGNGWTSSSAVSVRDWSSQKGSRPWARTVDGTGLDAATGLLHNNAPNNMGLSEVGTGNTVRGGTVDGYVWVEYDLGSVYELGEMWIWNYNELNWPGFGMYDVTIEASLTGSTNPADWTIIYDDVIGLAPGGGLGDAGISLAVDFEGAAAQYVVITTDDYPFHNHKPTLTDVGLSEVRFNLPSAVSVSASSAHASRPALNVINGSGIDPNNLGIGDDHDREFANMWLSGNLAASAANINNGTVAGSHWIRFDFDQVYELDKMWIWNYNEFNWPWMGMKEVTIEYSALDDPNEPEDWATIYTGDIPMTSGGGLDKAYVDMEVKFGGATAKHVVITTVNGITKNWDFEDPCETYVEEVGLSEVRFFTVPTTCAEAIASGYESTGDLDDDCYVDLKDFDLISADWQACVDPCDPTCQHPWE